MSKSSRDYAASEQSAFWCGETGDAYIERNAATSERVALRVAMWRQILSSLDGDEPASIIEVGANIGLNLRALATVTNAELYALEPNAAARTLLASDRVVPAARALDGFADKIPLPSGAVDLAFTCGVLIHIPPADLLPAYREIYRVSRRYILSVEYFSKMPEEITYRGRSGLLFKRDFGAYWLENFSDLALVDYGFLWQPATGLDDLTWWLFRKS